MKTTTLKLSTGAAIPALGLGTWQSAMGEVRKAVAHAIKAGYRHIDCAYVYGNEGEVGQGLRDAMADGSVKRSDLFITSKLWCTYHSRVEQNLDKSLYLLGLDYVDLYLMHWPCPMNPNGNDEKFPKLPDGGRDLDKSWSHIKTYKEMEKLVPTGKTRAIGVANYSKSFLQELLPQVDVIPAVNQIENHPRLPQQEVVDFCHQQGIHITAYSPLGSTGGPLMQDETVVRIARAKGVSSGNILLSYHVARGNSVLAKTITPSRIEENMEIVGLTESEMGELAGISKQGLTRFVFPKFGINFGFPDKQ